MMEGDVGGIGSRVEEIIGVGRWGVRESGEDGVVARVTWDNGRSTARVSVISLSLIFSLVPEVPGGSDRGVGPGRPSPPPRKWGGTSRAQANFNGRWGPPPPPPFPPRFREKGKGGKTKMVMKRPLSPGGARVGPRIVSFDCF